MRRAECGNGLQACKAAYAVIGVHHEIANRETCSFGQDVGGFARALSLTHQPVAENILLGNDHEIGRFKSVLKSEHGKTCNTRLQGL